MVMYIYILTYKFSGLIMYTYTIIYKILILKYISYWGYFGKATEEM